MPAAQDRSASSTSGHGQPLTRRVEHLRDLAKYDRERKHPVIKQIWLMQSVYCVSLSSGLVIMDARIQPVAVREINHHRQAIAGPHVSQNSTL